MTDNKSAIAKARQVLRTINDAIGMVEDDQFLDQLRAEIVNVTTQAIQVAKAAPEARISLAVVADDLQDLHRLYAAVVGYIDAPESFSERHDDYVHQMYGHSPISVVDAIEFIEKYQD
jgi:hypothetical protein